MNIISRWTCSIIMLTTIAAGVPPALHAQTEIGSARINVPFAFDYGSRHFAPGVYALNLYSTRILTIHAVNGSMAATAMLQEEITAHPPARGKAVFLKSGSSYQLQALWMAGSNQYFHAIRPKAKYEPELVSDRAPSHTVEVALLDESARTGN